MIQALLGLLDRWRTAAAEAGREIARVCVAYEAGRDGFWLARLLRARGVECHVIHPTSIAVSREHRRAKTDRLDLELLQRAFLGWLRGEKKHCSMAAVPSLDEEAARRPGRERQTLTREAGRIVNRMKASLARLGIRRRNVKLAAAATRLDDLHTGEGVPVPSPMRAELRREMARLAVIRAQLKQIDTDRRERLAQAPEPGRRMVAALSQVHGLGAATAELLVTEAFSRPLRDRRAVARFAGLTGAPDESGKRRREKGLARPTGQARGLKAHGSARVRHGMIQLAWRFLKFQPQSGLAQWYRQATASGRGDLRKTMIVALARKLLIMLWRLATTGETAHRLKLRPAE